MALGRISMVQWIASHPYSFNWTWWILNNKKDMKLGKELIDKDMKCLGVEERNRHGKDDNISLYICM